MPIKSLEEPLKAKANQTILDMGGGGRRPPPHRYHDYLLALALLGPYKALKGPYKLNGK